MLKHFFKFIEYYGKNRKTKIIFFMLISIFAGLLELAGIGLIYPFLLMIMNPQSLSDNILFAKLSDLFINQNYVIIAIGCIIVLMFLAKNLLMIICSYLQNKFVIDWKNDINKMIMSYYVNAPYNNLFKDTNSEKIYNLTVLSSQTLETFVLRTLVFLTNCIIIVLILSLLLFKFSVSALATIIFVGVSMFFVNKFFKNKTEVLAPKMLEYSSKNNNQVIENIKNLKEIRIFSAKKFFMKKFEKIQRANNDIIFKNNFYASIPPFVIETILVLALIFFAGIILCENSENSSEIIASYGLLAAIIFRIAPSLNRIQVALNHMNSSKDMVKKMNYEYEKNKFDKLFNVKHSEKGITFIDKIELKNVDFEYEDNKPILKNINLSIKKGEFIGITGLSGAGKSTLADILMGVLPIKKGEFLVDSEIIKESNAGDYRKIVGYVPQEINILDGTYKNNVAWGINEDEIEENKVIECLNKSSLYEFVTENGGINSKIEGLSQGQKQRLAIARALYKNSEIIILDEATSSLDVETESEISEMLKELKKEKTIIIIAHRLQTIKECDKLIYLKDGEIIDIDTFVGLKNKYSEFERLINLSKI